MSKVPLKWDFGLGEFVGQQWVLILFYREEGEQSENWGSAGQNTVFCNISDYCVLTAVFFRFCCANQTLVVLA